jgi:hypothetical protein
MAMLLNEEQIKRITNREIKEAILKDGSKVRIFIATNGYLCQFRPKSKKYGWVLDETNIEKLVEPKLKTEKTVDELTYKTIAKFRKEALKASFTNNFIRDCIALPDTFEKWVEEGKKSAYEYGVTTGCKITGNLVSVESITKKLNPHYKNCIEEAIKNQTTFNTGRFDYNGYDGSISFEKSHDGEWRGFLNKEYKGCGNGYYYLLINDKYFIGYDID